jgi:hypothetical protein
MVLYDKFKLLFYPFLNFCCTILIISTIQWASIQFLANYCSTSGWLGPLYNIFSLGSPLCHFVNNIQIALSHQYINIWGGTGVAIITWITQKSISKGDIVSKKNTRKRNRKRFRSTDSGKSHKKRKIE